MSTGGEGLAQKAGRKAEEVGAAGRWLSGACMWLGAGCRVNGQCSGLALGVRKGAAGRLRREIK